MTEPETVPPLSPVPPPQPLQSSVNTVKFKVSIKELSFEYEGSREQGQIIQAGLNRTLGTLLDTQRNVIALPAPSGRVDPQPPLFNPETGELNGINETGNGVGNGMPAALAAEKPKRVRKPSGQPSIADRLREIKAEGYFGEPRSAVMIREHLKTKKGHNIRASSLSGPLQKMTQDGELHREQIGEVLHYMDKPFDDAARAKVAPSKPAE